MSRLVPAAWVRGVCLIAACMVVSPVLANEVEIVKTRFEKHGSTWTVDTTLRHNDTGWDHYADKWRVVNQGGKVLGERVKRHTLFMLKPMTRFMVGPSSVFVSTCAETRVIVTPLFGKRPGADNKKPGPSTGPGLFCPIRRDYTFS